MKRNKDKVFKYVKIIQPVTVSLPEPSCPSCYVRLWQHIKHHELLPDQIVCHHWQVFTNVSLIKALACCAVFFISSTWHSQTWKTTANSKDFQAVAALSGGADICRFCSFKSFNLSFLFDAGELQKRLNASSVRRQRGSARCVVIAHISRFPRTWSRFSLKILPSRAEGIKLRFYVTTMWVKLAV